MPELPDIVLYIKALEPRIGGQVLSRVRLASPFVLRSVTPPISDLAGRKLTEIDRVGKQIVWRFEGGLFLVIHLMIAGRLQWKASGAPVPARVGLAAFDFPAGTLLLTEAGSRKRASLRVVKGEEELAHLNRGGVEVPGSALADFREALRRENHTVKRSLTDPRLFSGIGNAYSDEILHCARLSPLKFTSKLTDDEIRRLHECAKKTLSEWTERLLVQAGSDFPAKVTAFRPEMAVHGRYGKPCPVCASPVQRIVYAENECNYCPACQTEGRLLADRAMSRLLKEDWPRSLDEWELHLESRRMR
jgi:formamidopyrimidine-DNA glycosylase